MSSGMKVIVFGPTGQVGGSTAVSAQQRGAKVYLALRDTNKTIPDLSPEQEKAGGFERVQADLNKPDTISSAVAKTGAKRAFLYLVHGSSDHMKAAITALKSAGIEFVVFLSSYGIRGDARDVQPVDYISWAHAQVEINIEASFGPSGYVAVRPGFFDSNILRTKGFKDGDVRIGYPEAVFDWIATVDIGRVCGGLLLKGPLPQNHIVELCGPRAMSQADAIGIIGKVLGKDIKITSLNEEETFKDFHEGNGLPEGISRYLASMYKKRVENDDGSFGGPSFKEAQENVAKYGGQPATSFHDWVEANKKKFTA